jgi:ADP-heptose:LPS heptosyltransferase
VYILTVRNDRLGDLILALPTLSAVRARRPDARLGIVASPRASGVLSLFPEPVDYWPDSDAGLERLANDPPHSMLFLFPDRRWAKAAQRARVPERIGTRYRLHSWRFNRRVAVHRRSNLRHEAEYNLLVAQSLCGPVPLRPPQLVVPPDDRVRSRELLAARLGQTDPAYVVVHPGSLGSAWNWPAEHFRALVERLCALGLHLVITGTTAEAELCRRVAGKHGLTIAGRTDLGMLAGVLHGARAMVVGSTGPMHLAAALGTPVIALFSSSPAHSPLRWGPLGAGHRVLLPPAEAGSRGRERESGAAAMRRLSPERVVGAVLEVIGHPEVVR